MAKQNNELEYYEKLKKEIETITNLKRSSIDIEDIKKRNEELITYEKEKQREAQRLLNENENNSLGLSKKIHKELSDIVGTQKEINDQLKNEQKYRQKIIDSIKYTHSQLKIGWNFLQQSDKVIRNTILNLGMSGEKANLMRLSFEESAAYVARLGGNIQDINDIMSGYADETGRARVLSAEMVKDIANIGKGTNIGIQNATKLASQFEIMGLDARSTMEFVQGVVDTSERMGVNTTKVLKNINDNFKRLNTYTFQQGVQGFAQMATYAEKFKIDISQALNAADVAKSLEGAVDLAAQLQVMGGEFAKTDPFQLLFLSRNDPAKFTEKIADMTKGVVSFRKMADGSFQKFISPADRDRLAAVAKSLNMSVEDFTQITLRQAEMQKMRQELKGMGLSKEQEELIEGAGIFNTSTGRFQVSLAGTMRDISSLTSDQAKAFVKERISLEERAKQALTFNETLQATIESLKATLLPILRGVNGVLEFIRPIIDKGLAWVNNNDTFLKPWMKSILMLSAAGIIWKGIPTLLKKSADNWIETAKIFGNKTKSNLISNKISSSDMIYNKGGGLNVGASKARFVGQTNLANAQGAKNLKTGAGIGGAAVGIGAGIGLAAVGISKLADSMSKLDDKQAETLQKVVTTLGVAVGILPLVAFGIAAFAPAAAAATVPMLGFGAAILLIGSGIGVAAAGIGYMGKGLGEMFTAIKGSGDDFIKVSLGVGQMTAAFAASTIAIPSAVALSFAIGRIAKHSDKLSLVGESFKQINAVLSGNKEDFKEVEKILKSISNIDFKRNNSLSELSNLLKNPLKVQLDTSTVAINNDITLNIDGSKFFNKVYNVKKSIEKFIDLKNGKGD